MKSIVQSKYGPPDTLQYKEVETPVPKNNEVRIKIVCASVNLTDLEKLRGDLIIKLAEGFRRPRNQRMGIDFSGIVESIGSDVTFFNIGDEVHADLLYAPKPYGAFAEYVCLNENLLRKKPSSMSFEEASTIPQAGVLSLQGIRGKIPPKEGDQVLINGAGGGVGSFAIQLAKYYGAEVTGVDNSEKLDFMRSLGADHVIDYAEEDYSKNKKQRYNLILDVIAKKGYRAYRRSLKKGGVYRMVGGSLGQIFQVVMIGFPMSKITSKNVGVLIGMPNKREDMEFLTNLFESKKVMPIIDRIFTLEEVPEAIQYMKDGKSKGKIVIRVEKD